MWQPYARGNFYVCLLLNPIPSQLISMPRGKYQGFIGGFMSLGYAMGPIVGGVLAEKLSWRASS